MQTAPLGAQSGCSDSQSSAAVPTRRGNADGADATAVYAAAVPATTQVSLNAVCSWELELEIVFWKFENLFCVVIV